MTLAPGPVDILAAGIALVAGYLVGSIPVATLVGRRAGVNPTRDGEGLPEAADVWTLAGPGWGLLALTGDLARGILPVAVGIVTWSWATGWFAGLGALLGACWPAFGRLRGGRGIATLAGVAFALAPAAGTVSALLALAVAGVARVLGRDGRGAAIAAGIVGFPFLLLADQADPARLAGVTVLYLVAATRFATTRSAATRR